MGEVDGKATYAAWKTSSLRDERIKMHSITIGAEVPDLGRWIAPTSMRHNKTKTKTRMLRHNRYLRHFPAAEDRVRF